MDKEGRGIPIAVNIVVESELFPLLNIPAGEDAHADLVAYRPLGDITIWITAMVSESSNTAAFGCIDILKSDSVHDRKGSNIESLASSFWSIMK
jgi:hypothetical protein